MRRETFAIAAALVLLCGCDKEPAAQDARSADQQLASDNLDSNDLTAIDAASGADSNMAADIDFTNLALDEGEDDEPANRQSPRRPRPAPAERNVSEAKPAAGESTPPETDDGAN